MKIVITPILKTVNMGEYSPALEGKLLFVWVNPPRKLNQEYAEITRHHMLAMDAAKPKPPTAPEDDATETNAENLARRTALLTAFNNAMLAWWAQIWSQHESAETHWTLEELQEIDEKDPNFLTFMLVRSGELQKQHVEQQKKSLKVRLQN